MSQEFATGYGIDTDSTFAANSDQLVPSEKAVKTALTAKANLVPTPTNNDIVLTDGSGNVIDSGKATSTDGTFASNSDALIPTQKAVETYINTKSLPLIYSLLTLSNF